ncbi:MAG: site-specific integrase [SAR324 cluster bacterium]|nr:site-specific integrase [SAR324 cluster bacterium]
MKEERGAKEIAIVSENFSGQNLVDADAVREYRRASKADETKRAFAKNWKAFEAWCQAAGAIAFPCSPQVLEAYLVHLAERGLRTASIDQACWAVDTAHRTAGRPAPGASEQVRVVLAGIRRTIGRPQHRKAALTIEHLRRIPFRDDLIGRRDKALLLVGFAGGLRRSELAALLVSQIEETPFGLRLRLERSKTDQEGQGQFVEIVRARTPDCCPVEALRGWLAAAGIERGAVFRSITRWGRPGARLSTVSIGRLVKDAAAACGLDPAQFGGHSLRAGCATYLLDQGVPLNVVAKQGRWKKADTVLRYDRNATGRALVGVY